MPPETEITNLEARNLVRRSDDGSVLLDDVSVSVHAGERWAVTGPTGAGKTLFLRALALLDPIDSGEILWNGQPVLDVPRYRRQVIYLQQRPAIIEGTVETNLQLPFEFKVNRDMTYDRERCLSMLAALNLGESFLSKKSADLSGGESQITAILRALLLTPSMLLLDEPTAALDSKSTELVEQLVTNWFQESPGERAFLWVTHDTEQARRLADKHLTMNNGRAKITTES